MSDTVLRQAPRTGDTKVLGPAELVALAQRWAPKVGTQAASGQPSTQRWYCRLEWNESYEVWLLGWNEEQTTDFHNHGGSSGAVVVAAGTLVENRVDPNHERPSSRRVVSAGHTFAFGPDVVHNVTNAGAGPSLSVHVYSPPLSTMTYFDVDGDNAVERDTVEVEGPEADGIDLTNYPAEA